MTDRNAGEAVAEEYYDSTDADIFYERIWGGEDIHIGVYTTERSIFEASRKTVELMARSLRSLHAESRILDLGAGYGGAARYLTTEFGCHVTCLNVSEVQNRRNRLLNEQHGLSARIEVVHGSFEDIPADNGSYDIVWSQDAFLHSSRKEALVKEVARIIRPGGELVFTDPMQSDDCPPGVLKPVYERLSLDSLGSFGFYRDQFAELGFRELEVMPLTEHLRTHYSRIHDKLSEEYESLSDDVSTDYLDRMLMGLQNWVRAADQDYLAWGILHFEKAS